MTRRDLFGVVSAVTVLAASGQAQERKSPHETVSLEVEGKKIDITYGRPSLKGRTAFQGELAPNGEVWRLGADEATKVRLSAPAKFGGSLQVPAGEYSMFAIPGPKEWTVILNKTADQWGAFKYSQAQDLGRFTVPVKKTDGMVEEFTIRLSKMSGKKLMISLMWQDADVAFPVEFS